MFRKVGLFLAAFILSCGGGSDFKTNKQLTITAKVEAGYVKSSVSDYKEDKINVDINIYNEDIFPQELYVESLRLEYYDELTGKKRREKEYFIGKYVNESTYFRVEVPVMSIADKLSSPYIYLNEVNPTNIGASYYSEVLATPKSTLIGKGKCEEKERCTIVDGQQTCEWIKVCQRDFTGTIDYRLPGTLEITDGVSVLKEENFGVLTGDGSGVVNGTTVQVSFNTPPEDKALIVAYYLSYPKAIGRDYIKLKLVYGDTVIEEENGLLKIGDNYVGEIDDTGNIHFYYPIGYKNSPLVAFYYSGPTIGGELAAWGNGGTIYRIQTRYRPIDPSSVKVLAEGQGYAEDGYVQWVDAATGEITVVFPRAVPEGVPIFVQYRLTDFFEKVKIYLETSKGSYYAGEITLHITP